MALCKTRKALPDQVRQCLGSWSEHVLSWVDASGLKVEVVRYEDMLASPQETFTRAARFLQLPDDPERIAKAIRFSDFRELARQEAEKGFRERPPCQQLLSPGPERRRAATTGSGQVWGDEPGFARLRFAFRDTGIVIGEEERRRLFEPFTQADGSITRHFGGTGLGLCISQRLVGLMGGAIGVTSGPGQSSTFSFEIRLAMAEPGGEPPRVKAMPLAVPATIRGARILLVDGYDLNLEVVQELLERLGFSVAVAEDGAQALATLETEVFDVVLMDSHMPVMDGLETTRRIRQDGRFAALPVIAMSAAVMASDQAACAAAGMNDHIPKPVMPEQLLPVLERWVRTPWQAVRFGGCAEEPGQHGVERSRHVVSLRAVLLPDLHHLQTLPERVRSYFQHPAARHSAQPSFRAMSITIHKTSRRRLRVA